MPIGAELRGVSGAVLKGLADPAGGTFDAAGDFDDALPLVARQRVAVTYRVLGSVEPYGSFEVGPDRMDDLLHDIALAATLDLGDVARRGLNRLRVMAERCRDESSLRIVFVGD
jgi:hypothetical protein